MTPKLLARYTAARRYGSTNPPPVLHSATPCLPAPTPDAVEDLTRGDRRVLVAGEDFERLRALTEALLRTGCRVEVVGLPRAHGAPPLDASEYRLVVVDAMTLSRGAAADIHGAQPTGLATPVIAIVGRADAHHRLAAACYLSAVIGADGGFAEPARVARDILSIWSEVRPLAGPGDLQVDRVAQCAAVAGRVLALRPFDFRVLRMLAEHPQRGCTLDDLCAAGGNGRALSPGRAAVCRSIERLRTALRRSNVALVARGEGGYRLTARAAPSNR